jgi:nucleoside-diphosphate-sugar epimerase
MIIYNLASGQAVTIQHVALLLLKSLDWKRTIHFNNEVREGDPRFWQADISLIKTLGFEPAFSLTDGIKLTVAWLKSNKIN